MRPQEPAQPPEAGRRDHPSVRSSHSLSTKYSEAKRASRNIRKNASMCVRSDQVREEDGACYHSF